MTSLPPFNLLPPDPAAALRFGRCEGGVALWLCPTAAAGISWALQSAWFHQLEAGIRLIGLTVTTCDIRLPSGSVGTARLVARGIQLNAGARAEHPRLPPLHLDSLPLVRTEEPPPPYVPRQRYYRHWTECLADEEEEYFDEIDQDDDRDAFADYAELSGMSRDEYMNSVG